MARDVRRPGRARCALAVDLRRIPRCDQTGHEPGVGSLRLGELTTCCAPSPLPSLPASALVFGGSGVGARGRALRGVLRGSGCRRRRGLLRAGDADENGRGCRRNGTQTGSHTLPGLGCLGGGAPAAARVAQPYSYSPQRQKGRVRWTDPLVIPSVARAKRRQRRGIALVPAGRPLYRDECDSSPPHLRCSARNDIVADGTG